MRFLKSKALKTKTINALDKIMDAIAIRISQIEKENDKLDDYWDKVCDIQHSKIDTLMAKEVK
jgi:hypothetical protein